MVIDEADAIARLARGEVVAVPTDTVYGLATIVGATDQLFALKERPVDVALPVLIAEPTEAAHYMTYELDLADYWPGALTIVGTRTAVSREWDLGGETETIGLRCPDDDLLRRICHAVGPLVTTSANKHGRPACTSADEVAATLGDIPVLDGGVRDGAPSTVVDATRTPLRVLRQGAVFVE
jgi:tRNA threonylcarbamoyl adenosine modification protein (Sua5/YciO/YrdC/YwlC family)